jgi:phenylalanyl-tRNA synthetase beta chain
MKISLNWLKEYVKTDLPVSTILEILTNIGLEVEGNETVESIKGGLNGLVIGEVIECGKHPDAEKLSLTKVNVGLSDPLSIVCGAPNVAKGQKVVVATVGATLYPTSGDSINIKKSKIRGEVSEGMICAEDEIGLGNSHAGIMILSSDATIGQSAYDYFNSIGGYNGKKIETDTLIEIGLTPNRSDATGHLGVAFDLAAAIQINYEGQCQFNKPDVSNFSVDSKTLDINVEVLDYFRCPRYSGICIQGVKIAESPEWLKNRLNAIGVNPINNAVDITNYVLHELGQPLHAFDYDKIEGKKIIVSTLSSDTTFVALDGIERKLFGEDLMICDAHSKPMCIAGVFGGLESGVSNETVNIFLESAHFNAKSVRKSSMSHLLRTDAASCFEKGTDPNITVYALKRAALLFKEICGAEVASDIIDLYPSPLACPEIKLNYNNIRKLIGAHLEVSLIKRILSVLDMQILSEDEENVIVAVPTNKSDVLREVDVIEEILRIYGFNNIEAAQNLNAALSFTQKPEAMKVRNRVSEWLSAMGFAEMMGLSLSKSAYYTNLFPMLESELVYVNNTSNQQLDVMRPSMLMGGLEAVLHNQNRQVSDLFLFEFGKTYHALPDAKYQEQQHLAIFISGYRSAENWINSKRDKVSFYTLKSFVENLLSKLGIDLNSTNFKAEYPENQHPWAYSIQYKRGRDILLTIGRVHPEIVFEMDIKNPVFFADINWDLVLQILKKQKVQYRQLAKFPSVRRDLALIVDKNLNFEQLVAIARKQGKNLLKDINLFDVYENEAHLGADKKSYAVSFIFLDENKTLKDQEVDDIMNRMMNSYEKELNALIRK